ncbi:MAG: hypothetical protein AB1941_07220 [Gemmatimonadota bacterium]
MKRFAQYAVQLSAAAGILVAFGFGMNQAVADPSSETASARACTTFSCDEWCAPAEGNCYNGRCTCK